MVRNRIPLYLGDWPWGREEEIFTTTELDSGVGVIPTVHGEGLKHRPHGSDWPSIREAGLKADKPGACPRDAASRGRAGYAEKGSRTAVTLTQRKRLTRWSQKALVSGLALLRVASIHPARTRQSCPPYVHRQTGIRNEVTSYVLSGPRSTTGAGANRKAYEEGFLKKPRPRVMPRIC